MTGWRCVLRRLPEIVRLYAESIILGGRCSKFISTDSFAAEDDFKYMDVFCISVGAGKNFVPFRKAFFRTAKNALTAVVLQGLRIRRIP